MLGNPPCGLSASFAPLWQSQRSKRLSWFYVAGGFHPPENSPPQSPHPVSAFGIGGRWNAKTRPAGSALLWAPLWQAQCSKRVSWFYVAGGFHPPASWINVEDRNKCPACLITCRFYPPENSPPQSPHPASAFGIGGRYSPGIEGPQPQPR